MASKRFMNKAAVLLIAGTMLASTLAGCGSKTPTQSATQNALAATQEKADNTPVDINLLIEYTTNEPCPADDPVLKKLQEITNTKLNIQWVPQNNIQEKTNIMIASGDMPEVFNISTTRTPQFSNVAQAGAFWDIKPFINEKNYPNLAGLNPEAWKATAIKGKNYGVPASSYGAIGGEMFLQYRADWLKKLNLKEPETMAQVYDVMKAFKEKDPDGNGKNDTIPLSGHCNAEDMGTFWWVQQVFNNHNGDWKLVDGKLMPFSLLPGTREALVWLSNAYKEGLIPQDFAIMKVSQVLDLVANNKAGMMANTLANQWRGTEPLRKAGISDARMQAVPYLIVGENKKYAPMNSNATLTVIPKKVPEAKMKRILKFVDYTRSEEGNRLMKYGLEGQHYKMENGEVVVLVAEKDLKSTNLSGFSGFYEKYGRAKTGGQPADFLEMNKKIIDARLAAASLDIGAHLVSDTNAKVGKDINKRIQDVKTQVIMGKLPITAWDDMVNKLKTDAEYQKIITEMNEAYKANN